MSTRGFGYRQKIGSVGWGYRGAPLDRSTIDRSYRVINDVPETTEPRQRFLQRARVFCFDSILSDQLMTVRVSRNLFATPITLSAAIQKGFN